MSGRGCLKFGYNIVMQSVIEVARATKLRQRQHDCALEFRACHVFCLKCAMCACGEVLVGNFIKTFACLTAAERDSSAICSFTSLAHNNFPLLKRTRFGRSSIGIAASPRRVRFVPSPSDVITSLGRDYIKGDKFKVHPYPPTLSSLSSKRAHLRTFALL